MYGAKTEVLDERGQEIGERSNSLQTHLIGNAEPDSKVFGCHFECVPCSDFRLFLSGVLDQSNHSEGLLFLGQPLGRRWPIWNDKGGSECKYYSGSPLDNEKPAYTLSVILELRIFIHV